MAENEIRLPNTEKLIVSSSPHIHQRDDVQRIMLTVIIALLPACAMGVYYFGWPAVRVLAWTTIACVAFDFLFAKLFKRPSPVADLSAVVTGILLGMNLSVFVPWWGCVLGALLAVGLAKQLYGGLGYNPFNPALVGRVGLLIAFPQIMTTWVPPRTLEVMAETTATPLGQWQTNGIISKDYFSFFIGEMPGCVGETSAAALILGGLLLVYKGYIRWQIPTAYIGSVAVFTWIVHLFHPETAPTPLFHILTGGLMLGAIYMATDMVTSPMNKRGFWIFGIGCGLMTCIIRIWGSYPEGVSFAILFMNALVPLIDRFTAKKPFGAVRQLKEKKA